MRNFYDDGVLTARITVECSIVGYIKMQDFVERK